MTDPTQHLPPIPQRVIQEVVGDIFPKGDFWRFPCCQPAPKISLRENETQQKLDDDDRGYPDRLLVDSRRPQNARKSESLEEVRESCIGVILWYHIIASFCR